VLLTRRLSTLVIVILLILIVAEHLGVNVLALTAALGLTGFALALSLKDTITNFISGIVIMISRPYIVGETIHIPELGATAKVDAIGIRSTTVVTPDHRLVTVPNSLAVDNLISNYSRLDNTHRLQVDLGLGTEVDLDHAREAIRVEVRKVDGVLPDKPVDVLFTGFGASTNTVRVRWWVSSYQEHRHSMDKVNSAIVEVTTREDISLPYPIITIDEHVPSAPGRTPSKAAPEDATAPSDQS
jgi:small conductance mechanosensitive channel